MDHTELIKPSDPMSSSPCGSAKVLLGQMAPDSRFRVNEWKKIASGVTVILKKPSVLCVCDTWALRSPYLHTAFHVVDNTHGTGNLTVHVQNLRKRPVKASRSKPRSARFCAFALALDAIETMPLQLNRVPLRKRDDAKIAPAKVTATSAGSGQKILRISVNRLRWQNSTTDTRSALVSAPLENIDVRKIKGFDVKTVSDPNTTVSETEIQKGTRTLTVRLTHHTSHGRAPPDSLIMLLVVMNKRATVTMKRGTDNTILHKLSPNGFRVHPPRSVRIGKGTETSIETNTTYASDKYTAIFLPYLIAGLDISVATWPPGHRLSVRITATKDTILRNSTAIGEVRFIASASLRINPNRRPLLTAPQSGTTAKGPEDFRPAPHPNQSPRERNALAARPNRNESEERDYDRTAVYIADEEMLGSDEEEDEEEEEEDDEEDDEGEENEEEENDDDETIEYEVPDDDEDMDDQDDESDEDEDDNDDETEGDDTSELAGLLAHYEQNMHPRNLPPADVREWRMIQDLIKSNKENREAREEDDYENELIIRLHPLDVKLLSTALAPFTFVIPRQAFDPKTNAFYYIFMSRERAVMNFSSLKGKEVASSRDGQQERETRRTLRV